MWRPILAVLVVGSMLGLAASSAAAQPVYPPHPAAWLMVMSPDGAGALVHASPWADELAAWPDGSVMGLLGEPVTDAAVLWVYVQDPQLVEGWMAFDRLADPTEPVVSSRPDPDAGPVGGVRARRDGDRACPDGFPIKGMLYGRGGMMRVARLPEDRTYSIEWAFTCFRTLREARAWGFAYNPPPASPAPLPTTP